MITVISASPSLHLTHVTPEGGLIRFIAALLTRRRVRNQKKKKKTPSCSEVRFRQREHVGRLISFFSFCSDSERHIYDFFFFFFWYSYDSRHLKRIRGELIRRYVGLFRIQPIFSSDWKQLPARCSRPPSTATVPFEAPKRKNCGAFLYDL